MMLELDCGNSLIKWRLIEHDGSVRQAGSTESATQLVTDLQGLAPALRDCRLVSVRTEQETAALVATLRELFAIEPRCAQPARELAGVRNGYGDYHKLGLDRWLALVGAYHLQHRACLVLDLGTAITADFVTHDGTHLGGYICPGMPLMRKQLRIHTSRIRYDDTEAQMALHDFSPGQCTAEAVERGCLLMLQGFAQAQQQLAQQYFGSDFEVFLTGGDAELVLPVLPGARTVPDLVFVGLALACP
ncbi:pantothenate kinase [Azomonas macrocytogenes]|uniref:Type III pantothenate kinase n=1 Tax=Azomonas macrocytogenes TaxID=69962 RepID=A0A839T210_AZOMA|nr:pantothenate kinase [Azomonas macrocytogenes]MBB3102546.1 type III pantothenate kinase [Azomonas macrocytogenes]